MTEHGPAVSRLCVAAAGGAAPLSSIQETNGFYRLYLTTDPADGAEFAVAAPGMDEMALISDLIDAIRGRLTITSRSRQPILAGFHVGIIKLTGAGYGGTGIDRVLALIRDPAIAVHVARPVIPADAAPGAPRLAVAITAGLFEDLRAEGLPGDEWQRVPAADAWLRFFDALTETGETTDQSV
jgi:hypothetical protein